MHILYICNEYPPAPYGGIGIFVRTLARELVQRGFRVSVLGYNSLIEHEQTATDDGVTIYWIPLNKNFSNKIFQEIYNRYYLTKRMIKLVKHLKPQIVESFDWSGPILWKPTGAKLVVRMHGAHSAHAFNEGKRRSRLLYVFEKLQFYLADSLVAVSKHMGNSTVKSFNVSRPFQVIYNPVDLRYFFEQDVEKDDNMLLYVGRIHPRKGLLELMHAFNWVVEHNETIKLFIAGPPDEIYESKLYDALTEKAKLRINFLGRIQHDQLGKLYNKSFATVFPSRAEAFGITIIESMACGVAPIVTNRASGPEIIMHGHTGLLVDIENAASFGQTILDAFNNVKSMKAMGRNARAIAFSKYGLNTIAAENLEYYSRLLKK